VLGPFNPLRRSIEPIRILNDGAGERFTLLWRPVLEDSLESAVELLEILLPAMIVEQPQGFRDALVEEANEVCIPPRLLLRELIVL
jgi:hypothetical protein